MGGGTLLYDAVYLASDEVIKKQHGRKALIILSDGVDRGSKETLATAIETAQRADTVVYSILFTGEEQNQNQHRQQETEEHFLALAGIAEPRVLEPHM